MSNQEYIIFVNDDGTPTGEVGEKLSSHTADTKRHLAFSCYVLRKSDGKFLATRRALSKKVWPGVWTNSFCGHPMPDEDIEDAIRRRGAFELGLTRLEDIACLLPTFRYTTPPYEGIIENEFCPVFIAYTDQEPTRNPDEVEEYQWLEWAEYARMLESDAHGDRTSYWAKRQYDELRQLEPFASFEVR